MDGTFTAQIVELAAFAERHFEVRLLANRWTPPLDYTIFISPDEGLPRSERFLWSKDSRFLLLVGEKPWLDRAAEIASGEKLYLLYDTKRWRLWCNAPEMETDRFGLSDLAGIDFGETLNAATKTVPPAAKPPEPAR